jgi:nitroreductase
MVLVQAQKTILLILEQNFHAERNFELDPKVLRAIDKIKEQFSGVSATSQNYTSRVEYFKDVKSDFRSFSNSRASIRHFSLTEQIPTSSLLNALELARNTPSACNRQTWRSYIISDRKKIDTILDCQAGSGGFGHLTDKLIIITAEIGVFSGVHERNAAYIDGGMYLMNVLYALHYYEIAACPLNCSTDNKKDKLLRKLCNIRATEVMISIVSCGVASDFFKYPLSKRYELNATNTMLDLLE